MTEKEIRPAANGADHADTATPTPSSGSRQCPKCHQLKNLNEMAPDRRAKDGRRSVCKSCRSAYDSSRYSAKPDAILSQQRGYRRKNQGVRWRAEYRRRAIGFNIEPVDQLLTREAIVAHWGDCCFYCDDGDFEQIDHFIAVAAGGHHLLDNVVPCCRACNAKKRWQIDERAIRLFRTALTESGVDALSDAVRSKLRPAETTAP